MMLPPVQMGAPSHPISARRAAGPSPVGLRQDSSLSFRKSRFAEAFDVLSRLPPTYTCHHGGNAKIGFELKQSGRCLPGFHVIAQMSRGYGEAAISHRKMLVLAEGFLGCHDCRIETLQSNESTRYSRLRKINHRVERA